MRTPFWLAPLLFGVYPALYLFAKNTRWWPLHELPPYLLGLAVLGLTLVLLAMLVLRDRRKAGVLVSVLLLLAFSYQPVLESVGYRRFGPLVLGGHAALLCVWFVVTLSSAAWIARTRHDLSSAATLLTVSGLFLALINVGGLALHALRSARVRATLPASRPLDGLSPTTEVSGLRPDIYYIILDRYPDAWTLREIYGHDNGPFYGFLTSRGFYVATESRSNYLKTALSLASSLNLDYINHLSEELGTSHTDWTPLYPLLQDYRLWRFLKEKGYRFVHIGSDFQATRFNPYADCNVNIFTPHRCFYDLLWLTPFGVLSERAGIEFLDFRRRQWHRVRFEFEQLPPVSRENEPKFVFVHLLLPHPPYVFDRNGAFVERHIEWKRPREERFRDQLIYTNMQVCRAVDRILAQSAVPPIIVVQGDEGPFPQRYDEDLAGFDWRQASLQELKEKTGILNAYFLPDAGKEKLYPSISPVNSFRVVLNAYFGTRIALLRDEVYGHVNDHRPFDFFSLTDRLRSGMKQSRPAVGPQRVSVSEARQLHRTN